MKKTFLRLVVSLVALSMLFSLAACGSSDGTDKSSGDANSSGVSDTAKGSAPAEKTKISVYHMYVDSYMGIEGVEFRNLIKQFPIDNPDIEIDEQKVAHDIYMTKIQTLGASNDLPEVFTALPPLQQTFIKNQSRRESYPLLDQIPETVTKSPSFIVLGISSGKTIRNVAASDVSG